MTSSEFLITIFKEIWKSAVEEANRIIEDARRRAQKIIEEARTKNEEVKAAAKERVLSQIKSQISREFSLRKFEIRRRYYEKRAKLLEKILEEAWAQCLETIKNNENIYRESLRALLYEAIKALESEELVIYACSERDRAILEEILAFDKSLANANIRVEKRYINCYGGIVVTSADGKLIYNNTLRARFNKAKEELLPELIFSS